MRFVVDKEEGCLVEDDWGVSEYNGGHVSPFGSGSVPAGRGVRVCVLVR